MKLTARQQQVLATVEALHRQRRMTVRRLAQELGLRSLAGVHVHLERLESKGLLERVPLGDAGRMNRWQPVE